jgi:hypothetical protein
MPVKVIASSKCPSWDAIKKRIDDRRVVLENARSMNLTRLNNDVERIAKREIEFAKQIFEEIVPFKVEWNQEAWEKVKTTMPVRIVPNKDAPTPPTSVSSMDEEPKSTETM